MKTLLLIDYIQQYFDEDMVFQVTDDEGKAQTVRVTAEQFGAIKARIFDLVIKEAPETATSQEEAWRDLNTSLPQIAQFGPVWGKVLVMASPLRDKEKYLKMMEEAEQGPSVMPKISLSINWHECTPQEKAEFAQLAGLPALAQYESQQGKGPQHDDKMTVELQKTAMREATRVGLEHSKLKLQEGETLADVQLQLRQQEVDKEMAAQQQMADQQLAVQQASQKESQRG
jgi:hypothetical protein